MSDPSVAKHESTAAAGRFWPTRALGMGLDVGHPLVDHLERHRRLVERDGGPGVGEPDDLVAGVAVASSMRCRVANDWWLWCMSSSSSR